ncbi:MAG: phosphatidate cytidylyltransferase [Christensenellales bacterium]
MALLGLFAAIAGQIGDLAASLVKRNVGIDFGKIFPGHGGVMDRLDSILFVAPLVYSYFSLVLLAG